MSDEECLNLKSVEKEEIKGLGNIERHRKTNKKIKERRKGGGAVNELGVFAMTGQGLREVSNPSAIFLSRGEEDTSGSSVMVNRLYILG